MPRRWLALASAVALVWLIVARISAPSDGFDQTQPRTMSYTTDIVVNGRWILPFERGAVPATKPPLYNWLAAPAVRVFGFASDVAHRLPSLLALVIAWAVLAFLGERVARPGTGWLASMMFVASYTVFKLGYLARPDMLLTLWLLLGWLAATALLVDERRTMQWRLMLWSSFAAALLTKGPAALVLVVYGLVAAPVLGGGWRSTRRLGWWGLPLALIPFSVWLVLVYRQAPDHVVQQLWLEELYGRMTGMGGEGTGAGPVELLRRLAHMPVYFLLRFAPWSLLAVGALIVLRRDASPSPSTRRWLRAACAYAAITIVLFSLSAGKRADYLAGALAPAALLAGWLIERGGRRAAIGSVGVAGIALAVMTVYDRLELGSPMPGLGPALERFVDDARSHLAADPMPVAFWTAGTSQVQAQLGFSVVDGPASVRTLLEGGEPIWVIAGERPSPPRTLEAWLERLATRRGETPPDVVEVVRGPELPWTDSWPHRLRLLRLEPRPAP